MDKDGDGKISYQEYLTVMAKLGTHHNAMQSFVEDIADQHFIITGKVARSLFLVMDHETRKSWRGKLGELRGDPGRRGCRAELVELEGIFSLSRFFILRKKFK